jgi:hypothetical protein
LHIYPVDIHLGGQAIYILTIGATLLRFLHMRFRQLVMHTLPVQVKRKTFYVSAYYNIGPGMPMLIHYLPFVLAEKQAAVPGTNLCVAAKSNRQHDKQHA